MAQIDPILAAMVLILVGFFFFLYLMLRRALYDFRKGMKEGDR